MEPLLTLIPTILWNTSVLRSSLRERPLRLLMGGFRYQTEKGFGEKSGGRVFPGENLREDRLLGAGGQKQRALGTGGTLGAPFQGWGTA